MAKFTLSVDGGVVERAKQYAKQRGVSVSEMVEGYLDAVAQPVAQPVAMKRVAPVLQSLRGVLKSGDRDAYREHLAAKYR